jgi:uncharacterized protein
MTDGVARRVWRALLLAPRRVPVLLLRLYRLVVSPMYGETCRFYPSCSAYALEAFDRHGVFRGAWLTVRRLLRCHPWNPGGVDPVPPVIRRRRTPHETACATHADEPSLRRAA